MSLVASHNKLIAHVYADITDDNVAEILNRLRTKAGNPLSDNYKASIYNTLRKQNKVTKVPSVLKLHRHRNGKASYTTPGLLQVLRYAYSYDLMRNDDSRLTPWVVKALLLVTGTYMTVSQLFKLREHVLDRTVKHNSPLMIQTTPIKIHPELFNLRLGRDGYIKNSSSSEDTGDAGRAIPRRSVIINVRLKQLYISLNVTEPPPIHLGLQSFRAFNKDALYNALTLPISRPTGAAGRQSS